MTANRSPVGACNRPRAGARITLRGTIRPGIKEKRLKLDDSERARWEAFWSQENIDTRIDYDPDDPLYDIALKNQKLIARCKDGDTVDYTIETVDRRTKWGIRRGIKGVDLAVV